MEKASVTAVSYLNTVPFVYGMQARAIESINLSLDVPSECARKILQQEVDFGLAPCGILPLMSKNYLPMDYCIAAEGNVQSVMLYSKVPLDAITRIHLDSDSRTSVLLVRILAENFWKIRPVWVDKVNVAPGSEVDSLLAIGDKAFALAGEYPFAWDLAGEWKKMTGLPFVFAQWVSRCGNEDPRQKTMENALGFGISHIEDALGLVERSRYPGVDISYYLRENIKFSMQPQYRKGLQTFLELLKSGGY